MTLVKSNLFLEEKREIIQNLGPGKYNPKKLSMANSSIACSTIRNKSTRLPSSHSQVPGPGMYQTLKYRSTGYDQGKKVGEKYKNRPTSSFHRPRTANYLKIRPQSQAQKTNLRSRAISAKLGPPPRYNFSVRYLLDIGQDELEDSGDVILIGSNSFREHGGVEFTKTKEVKNKNEISGRLEISNKNLQDKSSSDVKFSRKEKQIRDNYRNKTMSRAYSSKFQAYRNKNIIAINSQHPLNKDKVTHYIENNNFNSTHNLKSKGKNSFKINSRSKTFEPKNEKNEKKVYHKIHPQLSPYPVYVPFNSHTDKYATQHHLQIQKNPPFNQTDEFVGPGTYLPPEHVTPLYPGIADAQKLPASDYMFLSRDQKGLTQQKPNFLKWTMFEDDPRQMGDTDIRFGVVNAKKKDFRFRDLDAEKEVFLV